MEPQHLNVQQQLDLFASRGMIISDNESAITKIENIGYYKLKEFAFPLSKVVKDEAGNNVRRYDGVNFNDVITRYYQDKNLRIWLLHAIEKIEVSLKTKISFILGETHGAFGYLNFSNWCNKKEYCKHYLADQQIKFKKDLKYKMRMSNSHEYSNKNNFNSDGYPTVWLMIDILMFGDLLNLLKLMSKSNLKKIAKFYKCTDEELISWLKCVNFIRNICAHNSNILDIKLKTSPKVNENWKEDIFKFKDGNYSNRLAIVIFIVHHFVKEINVKYQFAKIPNSIEKIVGNDPKRIEQLGFVDKKSIKNLKKMY
ncbi:Abi family protein [Macrococcus armenti]|uniref:Abi family protein n=1 Tax=Macrococcus armenti TaxID=2875764 RepID=UPI001CCCA1E9|nr:Abi family protein [Macrococcus armenti]UBH12411.1 Abi family protein [Macrococcus armenti]